MNYEQLFTFALVAYNQERFIRRAVEGAFSQTYSPLEIILSDDCSNDSTFRILEDMAKEYKGPHKVILNRNDKNLGIIGHINRIFDIAHGQMVILAAGDDISLPERVQINYEAWNSSHRRSLCIFSCVSTIDKDDKEIKVDLYNHPCIRSGEFTHEKYAVFDLCSPTRPLIVGGAAAWSRSLIEVFGPLPEICINEDTMLALRTACLGDFTFIKSNLIKYRVHGNNINASQQIRAVSLDEIKRADEKALFYLRNQCKMYEAFIMDLETAKNLSIINESIFKIAANECCKNKKINDTKLCFYKSSFVKKVFLLRQLKKMGMPLSDSLNLIYRLLPASTYRLLRMWKNRFVMNLQNKLPMNLSAAFMKDHNS